MSFPSRLTMAIAPKLAALLALGPLTVPVFAQEDIADISSKDLNAAGDPDKRFFLIGPIEGAKVPKDGFKLLLVLPGGDGSANFNPFIRRILKNALPEGYVIAQLVAKAWSDDPNRIVWPTKNLSDKNAKFVTEKLIADVISEVRKTVKIDPKYVFTLGWSSGGPPCYAASLNPKIGIAGSFIAMSVFKPENLPPLDKAADHAYYLLHSPQDFIPISMAEQARNTLKKNGARTILKTYEGGHGWHGDVFGNVREGIEWLEKNAGRKAEPIPLHPSPSQSHS
jgi:predicted esterase